jgi:predicted kinase
VKQRIVITVGLPGSGKSTYLEKLGVHALSSDGLRLALIDDATDQTIHARVFQSIRYLLRQRLAIGRETTYVDATHLTIAERRPYIEIGLAYACDVEALFFDVPLEVCHARNEARHRVVPREAMEQMAARLERPAEAEGFARVNVVGPEMLPARQAE